MLLSEIKEKIISHIKSEEDLSWLNKAYDYALEAHGNQQRVSGSPISAIPWGWP
jgi:(p)ppGpp synthase/HD superfamily hydrolase